MGGARGRQTRFGSYALSLRLVMVFIAIITIGGLLVGLVLAVSGRVQAGVLVAMGQAPWWPIFLLARWFWKRNYVAFDDRRARVVVDGHSFGDAVPTRFMVPRGGHVARWPAPVMCEIAGQTVRLRLLGQGLFGDPPGLETFLIECAKRSIEYQRYTPAASPFDC